MADARRLVELERACSGASPLAGVLSAEGESLHVVALGVGDVHVAVDRIDAPGRLELSVASAVVAPLRDERAARIVFTNLLATLVDDVGVPRRRVDSHAEVASVDLTLRGWCRIIRSEEHT